MLGLGKKVPWSDGNVDRVRKSLGHTLSGSKQVIIQIMILLARQRVHMASMLESLGLLNQRRVKKITRLESGVRYRGDVKKILLGRGLEKKCCHED